MDWQIARLLPTAGTGGAKEQEQRATSALLAVMRAVPEFGKELVSELGLPRGRISTYTEVCFEDGADGTVRPDGAIVVERGKNRSTVLVEVKTRRNQVDQQQVIKYLEVARREGFDGVLVVDNNILGGADDVPVEVPKKKLNKVNLWQLSWWRIVTEAVLQHEHRGISNPDQAWILGELIAYLLHERSGVGEFDDMGPSWVKVREGARVDALDARQPAVLDIAKRWEQFVHFVALGFAQDLGRDVIPERTKHPLDERIKSTTQELAKNGTLTMRLKIPDAVGLLALTANLRTRMVTTSVDIKAPKEGRPTTQIRWLLRQLRGAPDDLRVEAKFVRTARTATALLGDVRDDPERLLLMEDTRREPRQFNLSLARGMGIKKGTGPGSFITETRQQAIDFYGELVQHLADWQPSAPRMRDKPRTSDSSTSAPTEAPERAEWEAPPASSDGDPDRPSDAAMPTTPLPGQAPKTPDTSGPGLSLGGDRPDGERSAQHWERDTHAAPVDSQDDT